MAVLGDKYVYIGMTKTASNWVDAVLSKHAGGELKWKHHSYFDPHGLVDRNTVWRRSADVIPDSYRTDRKVITVVREPEAFVHSFWKFRMQGGWGGWLLDKLVLSRESPVVTLETFYDLILDHPFPVLTHLYKTFTRYADYVCRFEHLTDDLLAVLTDLEVDHDAAAIRAHPKVNVTEGQEIRFNQHAPYLSQDEVPEALLREFQDFEKGAYDIWKNAGASLRSQ